MLRLTESAAFHLATLLEKAQGNDDEAIRLEAGPDGWRLTLDHECPGDEAFGYRGRKVLLLSAGVAETLEDSTLDLSETESGRSLHLTGPADFLATPGEARGRAEH
jgi:Fe-S cluster assembly iron-binding protein IscA